MKNDTQSLSIIDKELQIEGTISCKGNLIIKGTLKGKLNGESVVISEEGAVYAETEVVSLTIGGTFEGKVKATRELIILSTGKCSGNVKCRDLTVENGGSLNASVNYISTAGNNPTSHKKIDI